jgi:hypothetical protein
MKGLLLLGEDLLFVEDREGHLAVTQRMNDILLSGKDHEGPPAVK